MAMGGEADRGRLIGIAFAAAGAGACVGPALGALARLRGRARLPRARRRDPGDGGGRGASIGLRLPARASEREMRSALRAAAASRERLLIVALPSIGYGVAGVLVPLRLHALGVGGGDRRCLHRRGAARGDAPLVGGALTARRERGPARDAVRRDALRARARAAPPLRVLLALALSWPVIGSVWVPALAELRRRRARWRRAGVALGLFNICWAARSQFRDRRSPARAVLRGGAVRRARAAVRIRHAVGCSPACNSRRGLSHVSRLFCQRVMAISQHGASLTRSWNTPRGPLLARWCGRRQRPRRGWGAADPRSRRQCRRRRDRRRLRRVRGRAQQRRRRRLRAPQRSPRRARDS